MAELLDRRRLELAPSCFASFLEYVFRDECGANLRIQPFQLPIIAALEDPAEEKVAICAPPGGGKTILMLAYAAWRLGRDPSERILLLCNTDTQAEDRSRACQQIVANNDRYKEVFPGVKPASPWTQREWFIARPGGGESPFASMFSAGCGNPKVQGFRPTLILCDDIQSQYEARSQPVADSQASWIRQTLYPRLIPGGKIVPIFTRWSGMDAGSVFLADGFRPIHIPALNERDESYWPARFPAEELIRIRDRDPGEFACVYQGDPTQLGSAKIDRAWLRYIRAEDLPEITRRAAFVDLALKTKAQNCQTAMVYGGLDADSNLYVLDAKAGKWIWPDAKKEILAFVRKHEVRSLGMQQTTVEEVPVEELRSMPELSGVSFPRTSTRDDKIARFEPVVDRAYNRRLFVVEGPWNAEWVNEICGFPNARYNDQADAMSGLVEVLAASPVQEMTDYDLTPIW